MKTFTLNSTVTVTRDGQAQISLRPADQQIEDYLATYTTYPSEAEALADLNRLVIEQTPLMYNMLIESETLPQEVKDLYQL